ncbi:MAG: hypothetical protein NTY98_18865 [Verrucomicrobia bacterium]|nr:hypothetical protein [Verrucomicrobiota bacterium]
MTKEESELFPHQERQTYAELLAPYLRGVTRQSPIDWDAIELDLGVKLPAAYKALSELLPAGFLGSGISWLSPVSPLASFRLDFKFLMDREKMLAEISNIQLYPAVPGYLMFAQTSASIDWAYEVRQDHTKPSVCDSHVTLIDWDHGVVEKTGVEVDELVYRSLTHRPKLSGELSGLIHELFFADPSFQLFRPV